VRRRELGWRQKKGKLKVGERKKIEENKGRNVHGKVKHSVETRLRSFERKGGPRTKPQRKKKGTSLRKIYKNV